MTPSIMTHKGCGGAVVATARVRFEDGDHKTLLKCYKCGHQFVKKGTE